MSGQRTVYLSMCMNDINGLVKAKTAWKASNTVEDPLLQPLSRKSSHEVGVRGREAPDHPQSVLPQKWNGTYPNCIVTCTKLQLTGVPSLALCRDEFRGPRSDTVRQRLEPIVENSACVEAGTTISQTPAKRCQFEQFQLYYLRRGEISGIEILFQLFYTSNVRATRELEKKSYPAAKVEEKQFETLNKETATHIGIREAEDWFRPIDLAKECDIYISSRSGSHKEIPITYGYTQDPFKNRSQNFKRKIKENYPQYLERENKNCFICGDSSHCARDCEKRFKPKESNSHIHNRINVNTLKVESEKQIAMNSQIFNTVQTPSEEIITLSSCFGEQRMVEVKPINLSLNQHSPGISVRTAISPTLTEEFIIHPSVYSEIKKLGHAKSDVLLNESESSLGAHAYAYPNVVSVSNVIENSSYDLPHVKNFNTRNDSSSLIKDYKCNKIKSTKLKLSIVREKCSDIVLCKKANGAMKTSSVEFISRSPTPSPMNSNYRRFVLLRRIFQPLAVETKEKEKEKSF
ncbi:hypothetical protein TNCV_2658341 [Trichonephila clavipes]|nr:hypothetical protein TNCV_2658341 [Trichonephila clavipes]